MARDGATAYVCNNGSADVSVIDTATNTVTGTIPVGDHPNGMAITPDGATVYVANDGGNTVSAISTATNTVTATIPVGSGPLNIAVNSAGTTAYVTNSNAGTVSVIDTATNAVTATIAGASFPRGITTADVVQPVVAGLSPNHGPEAGGTTVAISGTGFTGASSVRFDGIAAPSFTVNSDTSITATAPAHADGTVDVTVVEAAGASATGPADRYTYDEPAPVVTSISPNNGPETGGTSVTITGTDFAGATAVSFGSAAATSFTVVDDTTITATAPAASVVGTVDITVTTPAGTSATSPADQYAYTFPFGGFLSPVASPPTVNMVHAGQSVPIQFQLGGNQGMSILAAGFPQAQQVTCPSGSPINTATETMTAGGSGLQFDPSTNTYTYVWRTPKAASGTCVTFILGLSDGTFHTASFQLV
jgi:YVTN family beta-propeller protein